MILLIKITTKSKQKKLKIFLQKLRPERREKGHKMRRIIPVTYNPELK